MKKLMLIAGLVMLLALAGCEDNPPQTTPYQDSNQQPSSVGGGCGLSGATHENVQFLPEVLYSL